MVLFLLLIIAAIALGIVGEDRIADQLPRAVVRDITPAIRRMARDARAPEHVLIGQQILQVAVASQRDDVRMLQQKKLIGDKPLLTLRDHLLLQLERTRIVDAPNLADLALTH